MIKNGFTLLEVIVAISIVNIVLGVVLALVGFTVSASQISSNRLIAANLAQEGIEVVRNIRDGATNWPDWFSAVVNGDYAVQYNSNVLTPYQNIPLKIDQTDLYNYFFGRGTPFDRKITLTKISDVEIKIVSNVSWTQKGKTHQIEAEDRLLDWK